MNRSFNEDLENLIIGSLSQLINRDYIYIDLPYHSNIGDTLIWKGTEDFLTRLSVNCLKRSSLYTYDYPELSPEVVIVMHGGGNFGDLYRAHQVFRLNIIQHYPKNRIIILPQTVYYEAAKQARQDAKLFRLHQHLTICARDQYSYQFLKAFGFSKNILLVPDMAFCIDREALMQYCSPSLDKDLLFQRVDKEKTEVSAIDSMSNNYDISDWLNYSNAEPMVEHLYALIREKKFKEADEYAVTTYLPQRVKTGVEHISQYNRVFSNRLHGAILSFLLGKEVFILDNSYGKNSQYYDTWLKDFDNVRLLSESHSSNVNRKLRFLFHWTISCVEQLLPV